MHAACVRACVPARGVMAHTKHRINITPATQPRTLARIRPRLRPRLSSKCHEYKFLLSLSLSLFWSIVDSKRNAVVCGPPCRLLRLPIIIIRRWAPPCILDRSISTTTTEIILLLRRHPRPRNPFVRDAYRRQIKFRKKPSRNIKRVSKRRPRERNRTNRRRETTDDRERDGERKSVRGNGVGGVSRRLKASGTRSFPSIIEFKLHHWTVQGGREGVLFAFTDISRHGIEQEGFDWI